MTYRKEYQDIETGYQAVRWHEPVVYQLGRKGIINDMVPGADEEIKAAVGMEPEQMVPQSMLRKEKPVLPELAEPEVVDRKSVV